MILHYILKGKEQFYVAFPPFVALRVNDAKGSENFTIGPEKRDSLSASYLLSLILNNYKE